MTNSIRNLSYDDVLTEIAVLQNLIEKFKGDRKILDELNETYEDTLKLLEQFQKED